MTTVAVMQPYFVPYAGYFRLFEVADIVVMFDCVQFPRRGWVHRNRLPVASGDLAWLTLPIEKAPFEARISELRFQHDAQYKMKGAMGRFPILGKPPFPDAQLLHQIEHTSGDVTDYLCRLLQTTCCRLGLSGDLLRSSELDIDPQLRGEERVLAIVKHFGGRRYVNPPGGRELYHRDVFSDAGVELRFLPEYRGDLSSILARLLCEHPRNIANDIKSQSNIEI